MESIGVKWSRVESREEEMTGLEIVEWSGVDSSRVEKSGVSREMEMSGLESSRETWRLVHWSQLERRETGWSEVEPSQEVVMSGVHAREVKMSGVEIIDWSRVRRSGGMEGR